MDRHVDLGSRWTCSALAAAGLNRLKEQACGSLASQYVTGLITIAAVALLIGVAATHFLVGRPR